MSLLVRVKGTPVEQPAVMSKAYKGVVAFILSMKEQHGSGAIEVTKDLAKGFIWFSIGYKTDNVELDEAMLDFAKSATNTVKALGEGPVLYEFFTDGFGFSDRSDLLVIPEMDCRMMRIGVIT